MPENPTIRETLTLSMHVPLQGEVEVSGVPKDPDDADDFDTVYVKGYAFQQGGEDGIYLSVDQSKVLRRSLAAAEKFAEGKS